MGGLAGALLGEFTVASSRQSSTVSSVTTQQSLIDSDCSSLFLFECAGEVPRHTPARLSLAPSLSLDDYSTDPKASRTRRASSRFSTRAVWVAPMTRPISLRESHTSPRRSDRHELVVCAVCGVTNDMVSHNPVTITLVFSNDGDAATAGDLCDICRGPVSAPLLKTERNSKQGSSRFQCHECLKVFPRSGEFAGSVVLCWPLTRAHSTSTQTGCSPTLHTTRARPRSPAPAAARPSAASAAWSRMLRKCTVESLWVCTLTTTTTTTTLSILITDTGNEGRKGRPARHRGVVGVQ